MTIFRMNVKTLHKRLLATGIPSKDVEKFRRAYIKDLYDSNRYNDYVIVVDKNNFNT